MVVRVLSGSYDTVPVAKDPKRASETSPSPLGGAALSAEADIEAQDLADADEISL